MGLFGKDNRALTIPDDDTELSPDLFGAEPEVANYNSAIEYLAGLSDSDYEKVKKVADIYRQSNKDVAATLEMELKPTTFIRQPEPESNTELIDKDVNHIAPKTILDDDDDLPGFLEEDEPEFIPTDEKPKTTKPAGK